MTDASPIGLGAILFQGSQQKPDIISFASKALSPVERRHSQTEKEALAIVWGIERFHIYLYGISFTLLTDHKPLRFIFSTRSKPSARIERWVLRLMSYRYTVTYIPGKENAADTLSRLCILPFNNENVSSSVKEEVGFNLNQIVDEMLPDALTKDEIKEATRSDEQLQQVFQSLLTGNWSNQDVNIRTFEHEFCECDGLLLRGQRIVIPESIRKRVLVLSHEGHPGMTQMKARLRSYVWWPKIDGDVEKFVKNCRGCQLVTRDVNPEPLKRRVLPDKPWWDLAIDYLGPLPTQHHLLVVIDYYSRYFEVVVTKNIDTSSTIDNLKEIFARFGLPHSITADNGPQFKSKEFLKFCKTCGISLINTTPYWPQHNGEVERQNRSILKRLVISQNTNKDWRTDLNDFLMMYRSTPHTVLGKTPSEMLFGRNIKDKLPRISDQNKMFDDDVRDRDRIEKEKGKLYADRKRNAQKSDLAVGDQVLIKNQNKSNKLSPEFENINYEVVEIRPGAVLVENTENKKRFLRNPAHIKRTGLYCEDHPQNSATVVEEVNDAVTENELLTSQASSSGSVQSSTNNNEFCSTEGLPSKRARKVPEKFKDYDME